MRSRLKFLIAALPLFFGAGTASGQAFVREAGEGRVIATAIYSHSDSAYDSNGDRREIADYDRFELYLLGEYGVTDDLTLLVTPSFRDISVEGEDDDSGFGYTDLGARYRLLEEGNLVLSVQGLVRIPGQTRQDGFAQIGQTDMEYDLRAQAGISSDRGHFAILEGGYRWRDGDPPNEFHIDATAGLRVAPQLWFIANSFNVVSDGSGDGLFADDHRYHNLFVSGAYEVTPRVTLQLGLLGTVAGRNALRERGAFASAWFEF